MHGVVDNTGIASGELLSRASSSTVGIFGDSDGEETGKAMLLGAEAVRRLVEWLRAGRGPLGVILLDVLWEIKLVVLVGVSGTSV